MYLQNIYHIGASIQNIERTSTTQQKKAVLKWAKNLNKHFLKKYICDLQAQKICSTSLIIRKMQTKVTMINNFMPINMANIKNKQTKNKLNQKITNQHWWECKMV